MTTTPIVMFYEVDGLDLPLLKMPIEKGIMGHLYRSQISGIVNNIATSEFKEIYEAGFEGVLSELVALPPKNWHADFIINLESREPYHFTTTHLRWAEYLVELALIAEAIIQRSERLVLQTILSTLTNLVSRSISDMRHFNLVAFETHHKHLYARLRNDMDFQKQLDRYRTRPQSPEQKIQEGHLLQLHILRVERDRLLEIVLQQICKQTGASLVAIYLAANTYQDIGSNTFNFVDGRLGVISSIFESNPPVRQIKLAALQKLSVLEGIPCIRKRSDATERLFSFISTSQATQTIGLYPLIEGSRFVGLLQVEHTARDALFQDNNAQFISDLTALCSSIISANDLRLRELQLEVLRVFELEIARKEVDDEPDCVSKALRGAHAITSITKGWGALVLLSSEPLPDHQATIKSFYFLEFNGLYSFMDNKAKELIEQEAPLPILVTNKLVQQAITLATSPLILDFREEDPELFEGTSSRDVLSLLCIPYIGSSIGNKSDRPVSALFIISSYHANDMNDSDQQILELLLETAIVGLTNVRLQAAQPLFLDEMRERFGVVRSILENEHEISEQVSPIYKSSSNVGARNRLLDVLRKSNDSMTKLKMVQELLGWFFVLVRPYASLKEATRQKETLRVNSRILNDMKTPVEKYADFQYGATIDWHDLEDINVSIAGVNAVALKAVVFGCIDFALRNNQGQAATFVRTIKLIWDVDDAFLTIKIDFTSQMKGWLAPDFAQLQAAAHSIGCLITVVIAHHLRSYQTDAPFYEMHLRIPRDSSEEKSS